MSVTSVHQEYLTTEQAAQLAGFTRAAFNQRRLRGNGPRFVKIGPRCIRYRRADVEAWLAAHVAPEPGAARG